MFSIFKAARKTRPAHSNGGMTILGARPTAGVPVTDITAFNFSAFFACQRIISETIAALPWRVHESGGSRRTAASHPLDDLLYYQPNAELDAFTFKELITQHLTGWGNAYSEIELSRGGDIANLWPLDPAFVTPVRSEATGRIEYKYKAGNQTEITLPAEKVFHVRGPSRDGLRGYSVIEKARESISLGLAAESFGGAFFGNGAVPMTVIMGSKEARLGPGGVEELLESFSRKHLGSKKARGVEYLEPGMDIKTIAIAPEDAQFLQTRAFQLSEMCRFFRIPPHKLADLERSTHNNIESQNIEFVTDAILPNVKRLEAQADFRLLGRNQRNYYTKLNLLGLLRGDSTARKEYYKAMADMGVLSIDEIRELEDLDPLGGDVGDLRRVPVNTTTPERLAAGDTKQKETAGQILREQATRLAKIEVKRLESIAKRGDFDNNLRSFYVEHAKSSCDLLLNAVKMHTQITGFNETNCDVRLAEAVSDYCANRADRLHEAKSQNCDATVLAEWAAAGPNELIKRLNGVVGV